MISIDKTKVKKPDVLGNNTIQNNLLEIKDKEKPGKEINNLYNHENVRATLNKLYNNKCAYCEGITNTPQFTSRIDHFRPKNGIKNVKNHKGYFWLGYEWSNLLPTCEKCNIKKSNEFPLLEGKSTRISDNLKEEGFLEGNKFKFENFNINNLEKENRLLLNPEIDKVEEHLYFLPTGEIAGLTEKGKKSIEIYDLNRSSLIFERRKIIDYIIYEIIDMFLNYQQYNDLLKQFFNNKIAYTEKSEYSLFRFFIKHFFKLFVITEIENLKLTDISKILTYEYKNNLNN